MSMLTTITGLCQDASKTVHNFNFWGGLELNMPLHEHSKWGLFAEGYIKRSDFLIQPLAWFGRLGASYYLKNGNRISGGIAYQYDYPYDEASPPYSYPDWRIWQQYLIKKTGRRNPEHFWEHRFRTEERWLGRRYDSSKTTTGWDYYKFELTFRYMIRSQWYFNRRFGVAVYDELHLRLASSEPNEKLIDQNRIYAGIIYTLNTRREWRIETGYMNQAQWSSSDEKSGRTRVNHTWRVTLTGDIPLRKEKENKTTTANGWMLAKNK